MQSVNTTLKAITTTHTASVPPAATLAPGKYILPITKAVPDGGQAAPFGGRFYVTLEYPNGLTRDHHVSTVAELAGKITMNLRSHFGAGSVSNTRVPASLEAGETFEVEIL